VSSTPLEDLTVGTYDCKHVRVKLASGDGNSFALLGRTTRAMRRAKVPRKVIDDFIRRATCGHYDHLLRTVMETVTVIGCSCCDCGSV